ncbi:Rieske (2Fe-2S) protein [Alloacidobacterium dinghuense]|uniref:Rieske (2Fe-2S) protein n=1 Tax=Alloacidobacterium dinghuense TaxID=2763107 RepID=A0A7G8BPC2_9BACT|nr:Rieske (2Fe-2S) protein [Alloacidobacterium dinghuense]QNI34392.1 Rieske (2Fe-2S) protein [Alloacidobacterium dinghuense]
MSEFVRICGKADLPPSGEAREVSTGERVLCVANEKGSISVMDNVCPHRGGPLGQGMIEGGKLICPWHAWAFDLRTGEAAHTTMARVPVYEVKVEGEDVLVKL